MAKIEKEVFIYVFLMLLKRGLEGLHNHFRFIYKF